ncbi:site-2 protease family protein [Sinanaerobacter sp. ZZT-01]|uniref:site-2 protease family protein n=1 Tax=Sinanaerobacter sp. ZZT-01 TaxID=3111540 RepID=UPI002D76BD0A|nr:site-2 protease family protein [Sinanaerobacter sp. ZZT-01]WRR93413.1 site-2 protease family protein [Sinanaerobacter sp. ZZT-01]
MKRFLKNPIGVLFIVLLLAEALLDHYYGSPLEWVMDKIMVLPGIIIALSLHEFAHAKVADLCGDPTPRSQGRVTINPLAHIDIFGFIALFFIGFGWGRAVEINPRNFKNPRRDELLVGLAGVTMNFILAIVFMGILKLLLTFSPQFLYSDLGGIVILILQKIILINLVLMVFNLIPVPPLDGFNVAAEIFHFRYKPIYYTLYDKGFIILMILILFNITGMILSPIVTVLYQFLLFLFQLM